MVLRVSESFDWFETSDLPTAYGSMSNIQTSGSKTGTIEAARSGNGVKIIPGSIAGGNRSGFIQGYGWSFPGSLNNTMVAGFAIKFLVLHDQTMLHFFNFRSTANSVELGIALNASGQVVCGKPNTGGNQFDFIHVTSTAIIQLNTWHFIEVKFRSHASTGQCDLKINGLNEGTFSGNTFVSNATLTSLVLGVTVPVSVIPQIIFDDLYILEATGDAPTDYLGDNKVVVIAPNGNGNSSQFVGSDADSTDNYLHVDDNGNPDDDSSYVESNTSGNKDTYAYGDLPSATTTVHAANVKTIAKKVDAGGVDLYAVARSNTTETDSSALGFTTSYLMKNAVYNVDPDTASAWTESGMNAAEFGIKVV